MWIFCYLLMREVPKFLVSQSEDPSPFSGDFRVYLVIILWTMRELKDRTIIIQIY